MAPKSKSKSSTATAKTNGAQAAEAIPHQWPSLTPVLAAEDLTLDIMLPDQIVTVSNLMTPTLCAKYVNFLRSLPLTTTPTTPQKGHAVRVNDRYQVQDPTFAAALWEQTALKDLVTQHGKTTGSSDTWGGEVLGLSSNIRIYRYAPGHFFGAHYDDFNNVHFTDSLDPSKSSIPAVTTWTLLLYLSTCEGGETVFHPEPASKKAPTPKPVSVAPEMGMALLHRHGRECMLHEGKEVTGGEKWVIRSDLCVRRCK
ncbi:hypothetical protein B0A48_11920 [Cryoendolithus antarcticus]|uniref:Fe2OG dioxygenase domain-containing protein n=1 Tax=Cryoendolithus antarcticus TaxID=1507870 RepID=A0A1V8ST92_9PEZI|nr:hypothetical protein B0A48_11920 [Cryoendolithus antarcticus]